MDVIQMAVSREEKRRRQLKRRRVFSLIIATFLILLIAVMCVGIYKLFTADTNNYLVRDGMYFTLNGNCRSGSPLTATKIVVQKSQIKNAVAEEIRGTYERGDLLNPFDDTPVTSGIHYAVGIDGSVILCIPLSEVAPGNPEAFVIEYSTDVNGEMTQKTKDAVEKIINSLSTDYSIKDRPEYVDVKGADL